MGWPRYFVNHSAAWSSCSPRFDSCFPERVPGRQVVGIGVLRSGSGVNRLRPTSATWCMHARAGPTLHLATDRHVRPGRPTRSARPGRLRPACSPWRMPEMLLVKKRVFESRLLIEGLCLIGIFQFGREAALVIAAKVGCGKGELFPDLLRFALISSDEGRGHVKVHHEAPLRPRCFSRRAWRPYPIPALHGARSSIF